MDTGLDKNQTILGVLVLSVTFQVLTDGDSLLDQVVKIFGNLRSKTVRLEDTEDLVTGDGLDLGNAVGVTENNTNLSRGETLLGILANHVNNLIGGGLDPRSRSATIGEGRRGNTLTRSVHATHFD
jgi:hypothetical protein